MVQQIATRVIIPTNGVSFFPLFKNNFSLLNYHAQRLRGSYGNVNDPVEVLAVPRTSEHWSPQ
jgi:hypothetical protein